MEHQWGGGAEAAQVGLEPKAELWSEPGPESPDCLAGQGEQSAGPWEVEGAVRGGPGQKAISLSRGQEEEPALASC